MFQNHTKQVVIQLTDLQLYYFGKGTLSVFKLNKHLLNFSSNMFAPSNSAAGLPHGTAIFSSTLIIRSISWSKNEANHPQVAKCTI
jgi:hypothetical protein